MAALSVFRSQSFLQTISGSTEHEGDAKKDFRSSRAALRKVHDLSSIQILS
ncbi:hypothetical protein [Epilithonimonas tenax]|uniref:hypothetical protein n=1 Tax=Epilithonimonas tenax TaxID=191577 RepID=UPI0012B60D9E|nr:hypothetical protein [Epilithonimonas tenax]